MQRKIGDGPIELQTEHERQDWRLFRSKNGLTILSSCIHGQPFHTQIEAQEGYKNEMIFWKNKGWKVEIVEIHEMFGHYGGEPTEPSYRD